MLARRVRWLVAATITYNVVEAVVAITAGTIASSTALIGFGLDSVIEVSSAAAVAWQFSARDHAVRESRERTTLRIIAVSFFALAAYVTIESVRALAGAAEADHSTVGIVLAAVSLAVMPVLSYAQRRAGRELGSASAVADSKQTLLCTYLSAVLLVGLALNSLFGWSWADPSPPWSSPPSRSKKAAKPGAATHAAASQSPQPRTSRTQRSTRMAAATTVTAAHQRPTPPDSTREAPTSLVARSSRPRSSLP